MMKICQIYSMKEKIIEEVKAMSLRDKMKLSDKITRIIDNEMSIEGTYTIADWYLEVMGGIIGRDIDKSRQRDYVYARIIIAVCLYERGWSEKLIGSVLHKDHSTINHYRRTWEDAMDFPRAYPELIWLYNEFKKAINDE